MMRRRARVRAQEIVDDVALGERREQLVQDGGAAPIVQRARDLGELRRRDQPVLVTRQIAEVLRRQRLELAPRFGLIAVLGVVECLAGAQRHRGGRVILEEEVHRRLEALVQSGALAYEP